MQCSRTGGCRKPAVLPRWDQETPWFRVLYAEQPWVRAQGSRGLLALFTVFRSRLRWPIPRRSQAQGLEVFCSRLLQQARSSGCFLACLSLQYSRRLQRHQAPCLHRTEFSGLLALGLSGLGLGLKSGLGVRVRAWVRVRGRNPQHNQILM